MQFVQVWQESARIFQSRPSCHSKVGVPGDENIKDTGVEVSVFHGEPFFAQLPGSVWADGSTSLALQAGELLARRTPANTELQVLLCGEGPGYILSHSDGEGQLPGRLPNDDGGADVGSLNLHVASGGSRADGQTRTPGSVPTVDRTVLKGYRKIVHLSLIDLLINALLHVLKYYGELPRGGGVGTRGHGGTRGLHGKEVVIQQRPRALDPAGVEVVVEAAHVRVPEGGTVQEAGGAAVQPGKLAFVVAGVGGRGADRAERARAGQSGPAWRRRRRGALARAVMLDHEIFDAVHGRVEGQVPAAGARRAPRAQRVGAQRPAEGARAWPRRAARRARASETQRGRHVLGVAAQDLALSVSVCTEEQQERQSA